MNRDQIALVLGYLASAYPTAPAMGDGTVAVWSEHLATVDASDAFEAMRNVVRACKWFPSVAEFLAACRESQARRVSVVGELGMSDEEWTRLRVEGLRQIPVCRRVLQAHRRPLELEAGAA